MDYTTPPVRGTQHWYGAGVAAFGAFMILAVWAGSWISAPLALAFVLCAYLWSRDGAPDPAAEACRGCAAGCVRCRERIDTPLPGWR